MVFVGRICVVFKDSKADIPESETSFGSFGKWGNWSLRIEIDLRRKIRLESSSKQRLAGASHPSFRRTDQTLQVKAR